VRWTQELARVVLSPHGRQLAVLYPLLVAPSPAAAASASVPFFHYMWQAQVLSVAACPPTWQPALRLLLAAAAAAQPSSKDQGDDGERTLVEVDAERAGVQMHAAACRSTLPTSTERAPVAWEPLAEGSWYVRLCR
jgi:hypothetical protein